MAPGRTRQAPPAFRQVTVSRVEHLGARLIRVTLSGSELAGLGVSEPASSVRLLLPSPGSDRLVLPAWHENQFLLPDGSRPAIRTLTPWRWDAETGELDVGIVVHGAGVASEWAQRTRPAAPAAVSGPGRGYTVPPDAASFLLAGDETALPAISQLVEAVPADTPIRVHLETAGPEGRLALPDRPGVDVTWHDQASGSVPGESLVRAVRGVELGPGEHVWAAGEAAGVQRIRRVLFEQRGLPRSRATVRGYWKHGRRADPEGDD